jgi:hypothetical protein
MHVYESHQIKLKEKKNIMNGSAKRMLDNIIKIILQSFSKTM